MNRTVAAGLAPLLLAGATACGTSYEYDEPHECPAGSGQQRTGGELPYAPGPYGYQVGSTIPNLSFMGYARPDRLWLQNRYTQLLGLGCRNFALLFDDIPAALSPADREHFDSFAAAQSAVANELYRWVRQQEAGARLFFCPTAYCSRMAGQGLGGS